MRTQLHVLARGEQESTHQTALTLLERVGIQVKNPALYQLLRQAGAACDEAGQIVRFPPQMVVEALAETPRQWDLMDQVGNRFPLPTEQPYFVARVLLTQVLDYGQNEPRAPRKEDISNLCRLADALPEAHIVYKLDCPVTDVPKELAYLETIATVYKNSSKAVLANPINPEATRYWVELGEAATGVPIREQPLVICGMPATSPLTIDAQTGDSLIYLAKKQAPINCMTMPIAGASSPLTLAGTVAQHTAEVLAMIVAAQIINPGTPISYAGMACALNMKTGTITMASSALVLFSSALTEMAKFYGLPAMTSAHYTDTFLADVQCGVEKALPCLAGMAAGSDGGMFGGDLNDAMTISYEQLLIDYDIWTMASRVLRGVQVDSETLAQEAIERVGHGGSFLADPHTLAWLRRDEHYLGQFFNRGEQGKTMMEKAHERVQEILASSKGSSVRPEVVERIDAYVRDETERIRRRQ